MRSGPAIVGTLVAASLLVAGETAAQYEGQVDVNAVVVPVVPYNRV